MQARQYILIALMVSAIACKQQKTTENTSDVKSAPEPVLPPKTTCWAYDRDDDIIGCTLTVSGDNSVTGKLTYAVLERDRTSGTITGFMRGDTIFADYQFASGGRLTTREVVFLYRDNVLIEGTGPTETRDGKLVFKDRSTLSFKPEMPLKLVPCHK